jgi:NitT/TauT family transport system substrate-binding protein
MAARKRTSTHAGGENELKAAINRLEVPAAVAVLRLAATLLAVASAFAAGPAPAEEIVVSNYGVSANGMPYAVALEKGFFKEEGANVTGILTSAGGGTTLRNMLAGNAPYAEINPNAVISAVQQGADIRIVADTVLTVAEFVWAVKPESPVKSVKDLKGRKFGYTNPRSTSQALATLVLQSGGLKATDVELVKTGGFGEGVAALDINLIDIAPIPEPLWSRFQSKYRPIATASEMLPPIANVLGVAHANPAGKEAFIKAVLRARRKAVAFMASNPDESGDIIAKVYSLTPEVARAVVRNLAGSRTNGVAYWGEGEIHMDGLNRAIEVQKMVGAISGDVDIAKIVDTRWLPDDLKALK